MLGEKDHSGVHPVELPVSIFSQLEAEYHDDSWDYRVTPSAVRTDCPIAKWLLGVRRKKRIYSGLESIHDFCSGDECSLGLESEFCLGGPLSGSEA